MRNIYQNYDVLAQAILKQTYLDSNYVKKNIHSNDLEKRYMSERLKKENEVFINSTWFNDLVWLMKEGNKNEN